MIAGSVVTGLLHVSSFNNVLGFQSLKEKLTSILSECVRIKLLILFYLMSSLSLASNLVQKSNVYEICA
jgi:hypothetical protein